MDKKELHIYGPGGPHDEVVIVGNRAALEDLWFRLDKLLSYLPPAETELDDMIAGDGEGYGVRLVLVGDDELEHWVYPYRDENFWDTRKYARKPHIRVTSVDGGLHGYCEQLGYRLGTVRNDQGDVVGYEIRRKSDPPEADVLVRLDTAREVVSWVNSHPA